MLIWMDLETEGLEPAECEILEVALVVTDDDLVELIAFESLVRPSYSFDPEMIHPKVREMHTKNGLLAALAEGKAPTLCDVEQRLIGVVQAVCKEPVQLAGSTISFDRAFLAAYMPDLLAQFHYRNVDVTSVNELARRWRPDLYEARPPKGEAHRALADCRESIGLLRYYRECRFVG